MIKKTTILLIILASVAAADQTAIRGSNSLVQSIRSDIKETFDIPNKHAKEYTEIYQDRTDPSKVVALVESLQYEGERYEIVPLVEAAYPESIITIEQYKSYIKNEGLTPTDNN